MLSIDTFRKVGVGLTSIGEPDKRILFALRLRQEGYSLLLVLPVLLLLVIFFILPLLDVFIDSFQRGGDFSLQNFDRAITGERTQTAFRITLELS